MLEINADSSAPESVSIIRSMRSLHGNRGGFSIVEVLIAIAILTIGILAFLQLFPQGFVSLNLAADTSTASRLAQAELERLTQSGGRGAQIQQIAAIYSEYAADAALGPGEIDLDPYFNPDKALTAAHPKLSPTSDINGARYVQGELIDIPSPVPSTNTTVDPQGSSNALLSFGPIEVPTKYFDPANYPNIVANYPSTDPTQHRAFYVHGTSWGRVVGSASPATAGGIIPVTDPENALAPDAPQYLIDYTNQEIAVRQPTVLYPEQFHFSAVDAVTHLRVEKVIYCDWPRTVTDAAHPDCWDTTYLKPKWFKLADIGFTNGIDPESDILVRDFNYIQDATAFSADPYEYKLPSADPQLNAQTSLLSTGASGQYGSSTPNTPIMIDIYTGQIRFNPLAGQLKDPRGIPIQASVDYIVNNWHYMHEDRTIGRLAATQTTAIDAEYSSTLGGAATIRLSLRHLLRQYAQDFDDNVYDGIGGTATQVRPAVLIYNLDNFTRLNDDPAKGPVDYEVDYENGAISVLNQLQGTHLRIFYRPTRDWGVTLLKPAAVYQPIAPIGTLTPSPGSGTYQVTGLSSMNPSQVYLPSSDAGRMVQITNIVVSNGTSSITYPISQLVQIPSPTLPNNPSIIDVAQYLPTGTLSAGSYVSSVSIVGASLTTRVIWRESTIWRDKDVTTVGIASLQ